MDASGMRHACKRIWWEYRASTRTCEARFVCVWRHVLQNCQSTNCKHNAIEQEPVEVISFRQVSAVGRLSLCN